MGHGFCKGDPRVGASGDSSRLGAEQEGSAAGVRYQRPRFLLLGATLGGGGCISGSSWTETPVEGRGVEGGGGRVVGSQHHPRQGASSKGTPGLRLQGFWSFPQNPLSSHTFTQDRFLRRVFAVCVQAQLHPTLCDPVEGNPPGSSIRGIPQARILEWVAISFSKTQRR